MLVSIQHIKVIKTRFIVCFLTNFGLSITFLQMMPLCSYLDIVGQMDHILLSYNDMGVAVSEPRDLKGSQRITKDHIFQKFDIWLKLEQLLSCSV